MPTRINTHRLPKNTLLLCGRVLLIMAVSFDTSRVVLNTLGVEAHGISNLAAVIVPMLAFLNGLMVTLTGGIIYGVGGGKSSIAGFYQFYMKTVMLIFGTHPTGHLNIP